jgi:uncharacterized flavoprotein (TIGR03862 family)
MNLAVIGGGPAGLRAAEIAAQLGAQVTLFDAKASVGRKLLVAGRGGLNITKDEPPALFAQRYEGPGLSPDWWTSLIAGFSPTDLRAWAAGLGIETFAASTGRVYPREMKAAPLLRRWVQRLRENGVVFAMHHGWTGFSPGDDLELTFETPDGPRSFKADAAIFALGGASWPETGSDGNWLPAFERLAIESSPLTPANCGWEVAWPEGVLAAEGLPLKNIIARAGDREAIGELLITRYGLEGGALYQLGSALRAMSAPAIEIDFKPDLPEERLIAKMGPARRNLLAEARQRWKLPEPVITLLTHHPDAGAWDTPATLATAIKRCRIDLIRPRPIAEAISSAGGLRWAEIDETLMLRKRPGLFVAGEMIDWEAPTGGYLMQGCFATGTYAARHAVKWMRQHLSPGEPKKSAGHRDDCHDGLLFPPEQF